MSSNSKDSFSNLVAYLLSIQKQQSLQKYTLIVWFFIAITIYIIAKLLDITSFCITVFIYSIRIVLGGSVSKTPSYTSNWVAGFRFVFRMRNYNFVIYCTLLCRSSIRMPNKWFM